MNLQQLSIMKFLLLAAVSFLILSHEFEAKSFQFESEELPFQLEFPNPINEIEIFFDCNDNKFISKELICDGYNDCTNGADEENCKDEFEFSKWLRWKMTGTDVKLNYE